MSKEKIRSIVVLVPTTQVDLLSFQLWELGVQGIQELPATGELYIPQKGSEFREPRGPSDWTRDEKLIETAQARLKIFFEDRDDKAKVFRDFFDAHSVEILGDTEVKPAHYLENYRKSVQGKNFGDGLWIGPPWVEKQTHERNILIDPGMAFGTGEHPTTQMCVESLWEMRGDRELRVLDVGSGSGVLAIACAKWLPHCSLTVTDIDPYSDDEIKKNFALNGLESRAVEILVGDAAALENLIQKKLRYDLIISNIYGEVLAKLAPEIRSLLADGATWIATGVLDGPSRQTFEAVLKAPDSAFKIKKTKERRDAPYPSGPNDSHLWLCYEITK